MNLEPIAEYLEAQAAGTTGVDIFVYEMPHGVKSGVALLNSLSGTPIDHELPGYYKAPFQIVVRNPNYQAAEAKATEVMNLLTFERQVIGTMSFQYLRPNHLPVGYPRSDGDEVEFSINFSSCFVVQ